MVDGLVEGIGITFSLRRTSERGGMVRTRSVLGVVEVLVADIVVVD